MNGEGLPPFSSATPGARDGFADPSAMARMRDEVFVSVGPEYGLGILYGIGFRDGLADGLRLTRFFDGGLKPEFIGPALPLLFSPLPGGPENSSFSELGSSPEAQTHLAHYPRPDDPVCFLSAGYAAGWCTEVLGQVVLAREVSCSARGDAVCRFEMRPLADWTEEQDPWIAQLLPYLDFAQLRAQAREMQPATDEDSEEGGMMGGFDPMSPAAHVWGPVVVLPYSGGQDAEDAVDAIYEDVGGDSLRVVVLDLTGARIDLLEAAGLARVLERLDELDLDAVLVGVDERLKCASTSSGLMAPPIVRDISAGIALGFQMSLRPDGLS